MELNPFPYYLVITKTPNMSHEIYKPLYHNQYSTITRYQSLYGTTISIPHKMRKNIVVILPIYGALAISLLFCDHQDTEYESQDMENGVAGPILTQKKPPNPLWDNDIHTLQD